MNNSGNDCKICYRTFDKNDYKYKQVFKCTNKRCNKLFHLDCILRIKNNRNKCPYCKVDYEGYNFYKMIDDDYLFESDEGIVDIDYSLDDSVTVDNYRTYDINKIIKIQSIMRKIICRKRYLNDKEFLKLSKLAIEKAKKAYPNINNLTNLDYNKPEYDEF